MESARLESIRVFRMVLKNDARSELMEERKTTKETMAVKKHGK